MHKMAHNLKKVGATYTPVIFSAPNKLSGLIASINVKGVGSRRCDKEHSTTFVPCRREIVYEIPFSCGRVYLGQMRRCITDRVREHRAALSISQPGNLAAALSKVWLRFFFHRTRALRTYRGRYVREVVEVYHIQKTGSVCVNAPSLGLLKEISFRDGQRFRRSCRGDAGVCYLVISIDAWGVGSGAALCS